MSETTTLEVSRKLRDAGIEIKAEDCITITLESLDTLDCPAPTIAELRAYIKQRGEWEEFVAWLDYRYNWEVGFDIPELIDTVMVADSLALAYLGWKERKG